MCAKTLFFNTNVIRNKDAWGTVLTFITELWECVDFFDI